MCPQSLQDHLNFHVARLATYDLLRSEIDAYLDVKKEEPTHGGDPMDVDALGKGKSKGKGKGKGK
eukprot:3043252-Lingulodinium_polyedra.AAC.1